MAHNAMPRAVDELVFTDEQGITWRLTADLTLTELRRSRKAKEEPTEDLATLF